MPDPASVLSDAEFFGLLRDMRLQARREAYDPTEGSGVKCDAVEQRILTAFRALRAERDALLAEKEDLQASVAFMASGITPGGIGP